MRKSNEFTFLVEQPGSLGKTNPVSHDEVPVKALRILIVDDHVLVRQGLKQLIIQHFPHTILGEANTGQEGLERVKQSPWEVVLLDISMPDGSGLDILKKMLSIQPNLAILVLSMHAEDQYAIRVLKLGAAGYITKNTASEEVVSAIRKVLTGKKHVSPALAENLATALSAPSDGSLQSLSEREEQVLRGIAAGKSIKEIAFEFSLSPRSVSTYRNRLMKKLKFKNNTDIIRYAIENQLVD